VRCLSLARRLQCTHRRSAGASELASSLCPCSSLYDKFPLCVVTGVFFAIECGNRYLSKNTIRLDEDAPDGPRADIAAIVLAAALANLVVSYGLQKADSLTITGNEYAMVSPLVELPLYMGLGLVSGAIAVAFTKLRDVFAG
jgi:H+/Cl- antiporter ClcA